MEHVGGMSLASHLNFALKSSLFLHHVNLRGHHLVCHFVIRPPVVLELLNDLEAEGIIDGNNATYANNKANVKGKQEGLV